MAVLGDPKKTIEILNRYHFVFQKKFGQNFLIDTHVLTKIIQAAHITKEDIVLEIGPGIGTMTQYLCESAKEVIAVEIDRNLIPILRNDTLKDYKNITIVEGDILKVDLVSLLSEKRTMPLKIVANLPYYITTPILMNLLESDLSIENLTVIVQKEVADRMQAKPATKDYGALSLAVQYYAEPYFVANVPPNCFLPRPTVGSAVIRLSPYKEPPVCIKDKELFFRVIRASFNQRRKTLLNGLNNAKEISVSKEVLEKALKNANISVMARGETLSLAQFAALADEIFQLSQN